MATMFEIQNSIRDWLVHDLDNYEEDQRAEAEELILKELDFLAEAEKDKVDDYAFLFLGLENEIEFLKEEAARVAAKRKSLENKYDRIKDRLKLIMTAHDLKKLSGRVHSITMRSSTAVVVDYTVDVKKLPENCIRVIPETYEPDKKTIGERIKAGEIIPGCRIDTRYSIGVK